MRVSSIRSRSFLLAKEFLETLNMSFILRLNGSMYLCSYWSLCAGVLAKRLEHEYDLSLWDPSPTRTTSCSIKAIVTAFMRSK